MSLIGTDCLRIVVLGYMVRGPLGGMVWSNLHFLMGLARLGHDVYFVEDSDDYPSCYDPIKGYTDTDPTYGLKFARETFDRIGFGTRWAYYDAHTSTWSGPSAERILEICHSADLLLNLCEVNPLRPWLLEIPRRALIDEDPAFTQIRHLTEPRQRELAAQHTAFISFGENIAGGQSQIPDDGFPWQATRQPVVLDALLLTPGNAHGKFTTVMQWESYPGREYNGQHYGMKSESFQSYLDLPVRAGSIFELAVGGETAHAILSGKGWSVRDPLVVTRDPWSYEGFLRESKAEFSVAKHGYVVSRSGWFSERSAAYLASGRPVVVQETGFSDWLPVGAGVVPFSSPEEALAGIEEINSRYQHHCQAAREIAVEFFDARKVLPRLLEKALHPGTEENFSQPTRV
jgi:hypothetical protein